MGDADHFLRYRRRRLVGNVPGSLGELIKSLLLAYCDGGEPRAKSQFVIELDADAFERIRYPAINGRGSRLVDGIPLKSALKTRSRFLPLKARSPESFERQPKSR